MREGEREIEVKREKEREKERERERKQLLDLPTLAVILKLKRLRFLPKQLAFKKPSYENTYGRH